MCGTLSAYAYNWTGHSLKCFYEQDALVGAAAHDSIPAYCNQSAYGIQAGHADLLCGLTPVQPEPGCVQDAGNDAASDAGTEDATPDQAAPVEPAPDGPVEIDAPTGDDAGDALGQPVDAATSG